jgi:hypothetical protein
MDDFATEALRRLPLAEAVLRLLAHMASTAFLTGVYERHRGRSYQKLLTFPVLVHLVADALLQYRGSARRSFEQGRADGSLETSIAAAFGKLRRLPVTLSMGFVTDCTVRLLELFPAIAAVDIPASLADLEPVILDGKAIKRVSKRLRPLQGVKGGVLGGRALVALRLRQGLVVAMHAHPDGDANDVRFVPQLLPQLRRVVPGARLFVGDRQFCCLSHMELYAAAPDHFLIRYHPQVGFHRDPERPVATGTDAHGRAFEVEWGWLGRPGHRHRRRVRRITLRRPQEEDVILLTDLEDAARYPATDLLDLYLLRWSIERFFQQVTEVFGLQGLIGSSPAATLFQFAFCLVLYNSLQVVRAYVAQGSKEPVAAVSTEKLFLDVQNQLIAWNELLQPNETLKLIQPLTVQQTRARLRQLLSKQWKEVWRKASPQQRTPPPHSRGKRGHVSAFRVLNDARKRKSKTAKRSQRQ